MLNAFLLVGITLRYLVNLWFTLNIFHVQHRISHLLFHYPWTIASRFLSLFWSFRVVLCSDQKLILLYNVYYFSFFFKNCGHFMVGSPSPLAVSSRTRSVSESESSFNLASSFSAPTFLKNIYQGSLGSLSSLADSGTLKRWEGLFRGPPQLRPLCISQRQREWVGVLTWGAVQTF